MMLLFGIAFVFVIALTISPCRAEAAGPPCGRVFGGAHNDVAQSVAQMPDGGYVVAGYTDSLDVSNGDAWFVRFDTKGSRLWDKAYGGTDWDGATSVLATADGGFIAAGITGTFEEHFRGFIAADDMGAINEDHPGDFWALKFDAGGKQRWTRTFGRPGDDSASTVQQLPNGNFSIAAVSAFYEAHATDLWFLDAAPGGDWPRSASYGGKYVNEAYAVRRTADGGFVLAGSSRGNSLDPGDALVSRIDHAGGLLWSRVYGGAKLDAAADIAEAPGGGFFLATYTNSLGAGGFDFWILKLDASGEKVWAKPFGGERDERPAHIEPTADGGCVVAGATFSNSAGEADIWLLKLDRDGNQQWAQRFGGKLDDRAADVKPTADGGYVVAGATQSFGDGSYDFWLLKLDGKGECEWKKE